MPQPNKPTVRFRWGTNIDPGDKTAPPEGNIESGIIRVGDPPEPQKLPYQWFNFLLIQVQQWIDYVDQMCDWLTGVLAVPTATVSAFAGSTAPEGWLLCDGSAVSREDYEDLFDEVGTTYGAGDGSTTFNVPDMRGMGPMGYKSTETEFNALGKTGGAKTHTLQTSEIPSHTHGIWNLDSHNADGSGGDPNVRPIQPTLSGTSGSTGGGGAHNNLQPYITLNFIIKY